jgi:hypothetical protein
MRNWRMNIVKMADFRALLAHLDPTGWQCRSVRGELPLVRIGPGCLVPVVAAEGLVERGRCRRRSYGDPSIMP